MVRENQGQKGLEKDGELSHGPTRLGVLIRSVVFNKILRFLYRFSCVMGSLEMNEMLSEKGKP